VSKPAAKRRPPSRVTASAIDALVARYRQRIQARDDAYAREESDLREIVARNVGPAAYERFEPILGRQRRELLNLMPGENPRRLSARYDSAQTNDDNRLHWAAADSLAADAANNPAVRAVLRNRARYEIANNCYASGVGHTLANDFVGTGPRLNLLTPDELTNDRVEALFTEWSRAVNLARILRVMRHARRADGEAFALLVNNPGIAHPVKLGVRLVEADQVRTAFPGYNQVGRTDGIHLDPYGNPVAYEILRAHPGEIDYAGQIFMADLWPARLVIHWFRPTRPGQHRGVTEILPALPLYATLRRYTQATLDAAEAAADMAVLLHTQSGAEFQDDDGQTQAAEAAGAFSTVPFASRMFVALPQGYDATQFQPTQPTQSYRDFKREVASEIGRAENVSRNVVLLDSSDSNFASGQLDHRVTYRNHDIDRADADGEILDRIFAAWLDEAALISGYLPQALRTTTAARTVPHEWHWDSNELGDPVKLANAKASNLASGLTSLPVEWARKGQDWKRQLEIAARGYGITVPELQALIVGQTFSGAVKAAAAGEATPKPETTTPAGDQP